MYNIADKMLTGCKFDFAIIAILTLQIQIACLDMPNLWQVNRQGLKFPTHNQKY